MVRSSLFACLAIAVVWSVEARGVEPVPFLKALEEEQAAKPPAGPEAEDEDEDIPQDSVVDRVAFESRPMQFPAADETNGATTNGATEELQSLDSENVTVEPLTVPEPAPLASEAVVADYGRTRAVAPIDDLPEGPMLMDESALEEMPFPASSGKWFTSGFWYASAESLWYDRSRNKRVEIGRDFADPTPEGNAGIRFTTLAQPFDTAPGVRATFGRSLGRDYLDRDRFIELTYTGALLWQGVDGWNSLTPLPTLFSPLGINVPGFNYANTYRTSLDSNFNSLEFNYRLRRRLGRDQMIMSPNGDWSRHAERGFLPGLILGTRLARVDEDFWFRSRRNNVAPNVFSGDYDITTQNWLLGMNIGGELVSQNEFYYWGLRGRAAPALTFAAAQQTVVGINNTNLPPDPVVPSPVFRENRNTQTSPGFIGDLTLFAGWNVTPNFSLKVGYDFLWVAGIATATRQFNLDNLRQNPMDAGGQIFYNGLSFGLDGSW